jgi:MFS family permease
MGWLAGVPVPFLVMFAPSWNWIVAANILLGANQGFCWSTTVVMKIDLVGPRRRGFAMGLNEFAGYLSVAAAALISGYIAGAYALRPQPFYLGIAFVFLGFFLSAFFIRETREHALHEAKGNRFGDPANKLSVREVFSRTSWKDARLFSCSQAGLVNNLNDGLAWGLLPIFFASRALPVEKIGQLAAVYPAVWGLLQLYTGGLSDRIGRKSLIVSGMLIQAVAILCIASLVLLGLGTAFVYPTLLAAVSDVAQPEWRASAVGVYRLWRDLGYAVGAIISGLIADLLGMEWAIALVGILTLFSGVIAASVMTETRRS